MRTAAAPHTIDTRQTILDVGQRIIAAKGFSAVGLNEILAAAGVPKGSFYHYFASKDAFGEALLEKYFEEYWAEIDETFRQPDVTATHRLMAYWQQWRDHQSFFDCQGKCLAVKLGAEVADISDAMRLTLKRGTSGIIDRLERIIEAGVEEGGLSIEGDALGVAQNLYQLWLGASVMVKILRSTQPFDMAMSATRRLLHIAA